MMVMDINLNAKKLHSDLEAIRKIRRSINGEIEIQLIWEDDGNQHMVRIVAEGPNLWVKSYYGQNGSRIDFSTTGGPEILNYHNSDTGCMLTLPAVTGVIGVLENASLENFMPVNGNEKARKAYIMCVFLASEMVRNELLEKVFLMEMREPGRHLHTWESYLPVYKNWAKVSKVLYRVESGEDYPTIYAADVRNMFVRLRNAQGDSKLSEMELNIYDLLIKELRIE